MAHVSTQERAALLNAAPPQAQTRTTSMLRKPGQLFQPIESSQAGLDMALHFQAAADEYLSWLQLEANRSQNTVRAYQGELRKLGGFLAARGHGLDMAGLRHDDLRAYQRHLPLHLKSPASRARALAAARSWLRWLARESRGPTDLPSWVTRRRVEQRPPKPMPADELARLLASMPGETLIAKRDRALVHFLISTGCRISEALQLDRTDVPR